MFGIGWRTLCDFGFLGRFLFIAFVAVVEIVATGVLVPAVVNIPYIGWLAAGWAALLGNNIGSSAGSLVNSAISDC